MRTTLLSLIFVFLFSSLFAQNNDSIPPDTIKTHKELRQEKRINRIENRKERKERPKELITLMGKVNSHGGYWGTSLNYTQINKVDALVFGMKAAWVIGHSFAVGVAGSGFVSDFHENTTVNKNTSYQGGYGGLFFETILLPRFPVHLSFPVFIGVGGYSEMQDFTYSYQNNNSSFYDESVFVIAEPGAELEFNIFKHLRLAFGAYYRYPATINFTNSTLDSKFLEGLSLGATFKLGKF